MVTFPKARPPLIRKNGAWEFQNVLLRQTIQTRIGSRDERAVARLKDNVRKKWKSFLEEKTQRGSS